MLKASLKQWMVALLLVTSIAAGCRGRQQRPTKPTVDAAEVLLTPPDMHYGIPTLIKGPLDPVALLCQTDADCVVTCLRDGDCCPTPCPPCKTAYRRDFVERLQRQQEKMCEQARCPKSECARPSIQSRARCREKKCVVERGPIR